MRDMLPIVEQLYDCQTDAERADWLLRVSYGVIYRDSTAIRAAMRTAGFLAGVNYIDVELAALNATRTARGCWPDKVLLAVGTARAALLAIAENGGAV